MSHFEFGKINIELKYDEMTGLDTSLTRCTSPYNTRSHVTSDPRDTGYPHDSCNYN